MWNTNPQNPKQLQKGSIRYGGGNYDVLLIKTDSEGNTVPYGD